MSKKELQRLKNKIKAAVHLFLANDSDLLTGRIHEQAISHRIAVYLEPLFKGYHVDCEYNKHGDQSKNKKVVENIANSRKDCACQSCKKWCKTNPNKKAVEIRPDIIIHKTRGNKNIGNILVIEVKKKKKCFFDYAKLEALTSGVGDFKYKLGVFIYFLNDEPQFIWFPKER